MHSKSGESKVNETVEESARRDSNGAECARGSSLQARDGTPRLRGEQTNVGRKPTMIV
jgi:hypothetical protein